MKEHRISAIESAKQGTNRSNEEFMNSLDVESTNTRAMAIINYGDIVALDIDHLSIDPCNFRILCPNVRSNDDVYWRSLESSDNTK
ncbi:hypothetical protein Ccrd_008673, partial [Cynara cardunculus var. scolymus]